MERFEPQKHEDRPKRAARCPGKPGIIRCVAALISPKSRSDARAIFGRGGALPEIVRALPAGLDPEGEAVLADQFNAAVSAARNSRALDEVGRLLWRAHGESHLDDIAAQAISEALQARRATFATGRINHPGAPKGPATGQRRPPRSPDRRASIERRRRQAASGAMPPALAAHFTPGEQATLAVVAREAQAHQVCVLPIDAIAALAGVGRSTVKNAVREARRLGLIEVRERRIPGRKSLPNVVKVISTEWLGWLRLRGGVKSLTATTNRFNSRGAGSSASGPAADKKTQQ
jgi:hypothetical protein